MAPPVDGKHISGGEREELMARIDELRARLEELKKTIPAHSTPIHHIAQIEETEEELEELEARLAGK